MKLLSLVTLLSATVIAVPFPDLTLNELDYVRKAGVITYCQDDVCSKLPNPNGNCRVYCYSDLCTNNGTARFNWKAAPRTDFCKDLGPNPRRYKKKKYFGSNESECLTALGSLPCVLRSEYQDSYLELRNVTFVNETT